MDIRPTPVGPGAQTGLYAEASEVSRHSPSSAYELRFTLSSSHSSRLYCAAERGRMLTEESELRTVKETFQRVLCLLFGLT